MLLESIFFFSGLSLSFSFECYTCNNFGGANDGQPCEERVEKCPDGVESCSMLTYFSQFDKKMHTRKFCTTRGTPIYEYLLAFPGSSVCQNIKTSSLMNSARRARRQIALPPAPPIMQSSSLLCVCTTPLCNKGTYKEVLERNMNDDLALNEKKKRRKLRKLRKFEKIIETHDIRMKKNGPVGPVGPPMKKIDSIENDLFV